MNLRLRLLLLVGTLLLAGLGATLGLVHRDLAAQIRDSASDSLRVAQAHFRLLEEQRRETLEIAATALEQEPGFRNVLRTHDEPTILDYLGGALQAYRLELVGVVDAEGHPLAAVPAGAAQLPPLVSTLRGESGNGYVTLERHPYQVAWLPLVGAADRVAGGLIVGLSVDQKLLERLSRDTGCQVMLRTPERVVTTGERQPAEEVMEATVPLGAAGQLTLFKATDEAQARVIRLSQWLVGLGLGALALALAVSYPLLGRISNPVEQLARAEARLQAVVEATADGLLALDPQGRVTLANPAAARALGHDLDRLPGAPLESLVDAATADRLLGEPEGRFSQTATLERERRRFVLTRTFLGRSAPGSLVAVRETTHELAGEQRTAEFFGLLAAALGERQGRVLDNLEVLAHGLRARALEAVAVTAVLPAEAAVEGEVGRVVAHPESLRLVLLNLRDNAERYGGESRELGARRDGGAVEFWVRDSGRGFDETRLHEVTDLTYPKRDLHRSEAESGLGIGLAVCQLLLQEMGTGLRVEGARLAFWLPQAPP